MRIVSLLPAATEITAFIGATDHLVGVTHECDYPAVVGSRARVTRSHLPVHATPAAIDAAVRAHQAADEALYQLDATRIRALRPDLILTQTLCDVCAVREDDVRALAASLSPPPRVVTLGGTSLEGVLDDIVRVAQAIRGESEADELLAGLRARVRFVHDTLKHAQAPRPRVALLEWTDPVFITGHWGPEQIARAGGVDVLGTAGAHSVTVTVDAVRAADPELLVFAPCGYTLDAAAREAAATLARAEWSWVGARPVWALDANGLVSRPGPRLVDGIEALAHLLHPTLFTPVDPLHARRVR